LKLVVSRFSTQPPATARRSAMNIGKPGCQVACSTRRFSSIHLLADM
jgi:hypothetical protein